MSSNPPHADENTPKGEFPKQFRPLEHEARVWERWAAARAFHAEPAPVLSGERRAYSIVIPPPNVTAALHLGHALNNTLQDILARAHRMMGFETLWMPGTDHAGIATQAVVERRLWQEERQRRSDFTREQFVAKVQAFKDEYEGTITRQLRAMGCSCDYERQRFTMDDQCARAVREAFFRLFRDGLIYRGKRLVNWDPALQTAVADDECYDEEVDGSFYYLRYPLVHGPTPARDDARPVAWDELARRGFPGAEAHPADEQAWVTVATTRPETYLGDTAVAINPHDPRAIPLRGLFVELPLVGRVIPLVEDAYVVLPERYARSEEEKKDPKAALATGFLKVTPAHDPNDYELGRRHELPIVNVMAPDASISDRHGWSDVGDAHLFVGKKREEARKLVVKEFESRGLFEGSKPHRHSVKHSDRSKAIVEPYLSDQWYVRVTDPRLAKSANEALQRGTAPGGTALGGTALQSGVRHPSTPPHPHSTLTISSLLRQLHTLNFAHLRHAGFTPMDPYPPGKPSPGFMGHIRNLPHIEMPGATYFVTWRVAAPGVTLAPSDQRLILESIFHDPKRATVFAAIAMPDHVHCIVRPTEGLGDWVGSIKKYTARRINDHHARTGHLWQDERFDHIVRDEAWFRSFLEYLFQNPVDAGLCGRDDVYPGLRVGDEVLGALGLRDTALESGATESGAAKGGAIEHKTGAGTLTFHPDRYAKAYEQWHDQIRDWCISRQLWWGHRIPVWSRTCRAGMVDDAFMVLDQVLPENLEELLDDGQQSAIAIQFVDTTTGQRIQPTTLEFNHGFDQPVRVSVCLLQDQHPEVPSFELVAALERGGFVRDPDVLDTWFSSALWPMSTMGWPDDTDLLKAFNPTSTLCTAREIITLWVSRMVMFNRYFLGEGQGRGPVPFRDVFIHALIQDGEGRKMSKSLGNGVDPLDVIATHGADAMRFTLCQMTTQTQDVRLPVAKDPATGKNTSPKFDLGRNFATKLWNAARFALSFLTAPDDPAEIPREEFSLADRWMLSRLTHALGHIERSLGAYEFSDYAQGVYQLLWNDLCDWYLEAIKPTIASSRAQRAVLAHSLDSILRVLHPIMPFVTEAIWEHLASVRVGSIAGVELSPSRRGGLLATAGWPRVAQAWRDEPAEREFDRLRDLVAQIRDVRSRLQVPPKRRITLHLPVGVTLSPELRALASTFAGLEGIVQSPPPGESVALAFESAELRLSGLAEPGVDSSVAERARLEKQDADLSKEISVLESRLANPGYAAKAPAHMVQQTKDQLAQKREQLETLRGSLARIR